MGGFVPFWKVFFADLFYFFANVGFIIFCGDGEGVRGNEGSVGSTSRFVVFELMAEVNLAASCLKYLVDRSSLGMIFGGVIGIGVVCLR